LESRAVARTPKVTGLWNLDVRSNGKYKITFRQKPPIAKHVISTSKARISIAGIQKEIHFFTGSKEVISYRGIAMKKVLKIPFESILYPER